MADTPSRLMLVSPVLGADSDFETSFAAALDAAVFSAIILRADRGADERTLLKVLKPLVEAAQAHGAAVLIEGAPDLVGKSGADGIHTLGEAQAGEAASRFKPEKIHGAGGLRTRDAAMAAGELNADYVLFGDPGKGGEAPPLDAILERLDWWSEIFVLPCVGQAEALGDVGAIAATKADFVALGSFVWTHPAGPADAVRAASAALAADPVQ
jgi:thiamine-phosphate pyrophosphorylase